MIAMSGPAVFALLCCAAYAALLLLFFTRRYRTEVTP